MKLALPTLRKNRVKKKWTGRRVTLTISGWIIGLIFISPYIEMLVTSVKPKREITVIILYCFDGDPDCSDSCNSGRLLLRAQ